MGTPLQTYKHEAASPLGWYQTNPRPNLKLIPAQALFGTLLNLSVGSPVPQRPSRPVAVVGRPGQTCSCCWPPWRKTWSRCCQTWKKTCRCQTCQTWQTSKQQRKIVHLESGYAPGQPHGKPGPWTTRHNLVTLIFPGP